jgi:hypothetical protein
MMEPSSILFRFAESVVNTAHIPKECLYHRRKQTSVSYAADCDVIVFDANLHPSTTAGA